MHNTHNNYQQIEDIVEVEDSIISFEKMDFLANNEKAMNATRASIRAVCIQLF